MLTWMVPEDSDALINRMSGSFSPLSNTSAAVRALSFSDKEASANIPKRAVPTIKADMLTDPATFQAPSPECIREERQASTIAPNISNVR